MFVRENNALKITQRFNEVQRTLIWRITIEKRLDYVFRLRVFCRCVTVAYKTSIYRGLYILMSII